MTPEDGGTRLSITVSADEAALAPGYYRVLVSADLSGAQVEWEDVPWAASLGVRLTNEQISAWEQFAEERSQLDIIIFWLHLGFHIIHNILMNYIVITNIRRFWHIFTSK